MVKFSKLSIVCLLSVFCASSCMYSVKAMDDMHSSDSIVSENVAYVNNNIVQDSEDQLIDDESNDVHLFDESSVWLLVSPDGFERYIMFDTDFSGHGEIKNDDGSYTSVSFLYAGDTLSFEFIFDDNVRIQLSNLYNSGNVVHANRDDLESSNKDVCFFPIDDIDPSTFFVRSDVVIEDVSATGECCGTEGCECNGDENLCISRNNWSSGVEVCCF